MWWVARASKPSKIYGKGSIKGQQHLFFFIHIKLSNAQTQGLLWRISAGPEKGNIKIKDAVSNSNPLFSNSANISSLSTSCSFYECTEKKNLVFIHSLDSVNGKQTKWLRQSHTTYPKQPWREGRICQPVLVLVGCWVQSLTFTQKGKEILNWISWQWYHALYSSANHHQQFQMQVTIWKVEHPSTSQTKAYAYSSCVWCWQMWLIVMQYTLIFS